MNTGEDILDWYASMVRTKFSLADNEDYTEKLSFESMQKEIEITLLAKLVDAVQDLNDSVRNLKD